MNLRRSGLVCVGLSLALALSACGGDDEGSGDLSGTLSGAGASSQQAAMQAWQAGFQDANPDVTINYDPAGSGAGREQFVAGAVDFAGSDAYLDDEERAAADAKCGGGGAIDLPNYISPIAVIYNLPGVSELKLKPDTIAKIFDGKITDWSAPEITADNGTALPAKAIAPVHRSDDSGTTTNFTDYLSKASTSWPHEPDGEWPIQSGEAAQGTSGVVAAVKAGDGAIGYADASQAGDLGTVSVGVGANYVKYSPEAAAAIVGESEKVSGRGEYDLAYDLARDTSTEGTYPIVLVSYHVVCLNPPAEKAELIKAFLTYVASEDGQTAAAEAAGSAPISDELRTEIMTSVDQIKAAG